MRTLIYAPPGAKDETSFERDLKKLEKIRRPRRPLKGYDKFVVILFACVGLLWASTATLQGVRGHWVYMAGDVVVALCWFVVSILSYRARA